MVVASGVLFSSVGYIRSCWLLALARRVCVGPCRRSPRAQSRLSFGRSSVVAHASVRYPSLRPQPVGRAHNAGTPTDAADELSHDGLHGAVLLLQPYCPRSLLNLGIAC